MSRKKNSVKEGVKDAIAPPFRNARDVNGNWDQKRLVSSVVTYAFLALLLGLISPGDLIEILKYTLSLLL